MTKVQDADLLVNKLYEYRDNFIENIGVEHAAEKNDHVQAQMKETLEKLKLMEKSCPKTPFLFYMGKTLNVMPDYSKECEEYLSKVVKRDPSHVDAWNMLGETFWKKGNILAAKDCFEGALKRNKNKESLRSLSMVLRQIKPTQPGDQHKNVLESVEHAKAAVELDTKDGRSWYILGNAYLSLFFVSEQHSKILLLSLNAYSQAEKVDKTSVHNPDLHFNRAVACRYEQNYKLALEGFQKATVLDPTWPEPSQKIDELCKYLDKVSEFVEKKGKLKNKRLQTLIKAIKEKDLGLYAGGSYTSRDKTVALVSTNLSDLKQGLNEEKVLLGRVVCNFADLTLVPFTLALVDATGACFSVTIYNLAQGRGMIIGDSVAIPEPYVTRHDLSWTRGDSEVHWKFSNVRVDNPVVLVVNGKKLTNDHCGFTKASMTLGK